MLTNVSEMYKDRLSGVSVGIGFVAYLFVNGSVVLHSRKRENNISKQ